MAATVDEATRAVEAICAGGIPIVEITMTVPDAVTVIRQVARPVFKRCSDWGRNSHYGAVSGRRCALQLEQSSW